MTIPEARLRCGDTEAVICASGASIRSLRRAGRPLLREFSGEHPPEAANAVLAPWPNRVGGAAFEFRGRTHRLRVTEPERGHALHGFTLGTVFTLLADRERARLRAVLGPEEGWPWRIELTVVYEALPEGLRARLSARNLSEVAAPCALGAHPYLDPQGRPLDECTLLFDAAHRLPLGPSLIPLGEREPWSEPAIAMRGRGFDDAFVHAPGAHEVRLMHPDGRGVALRSAMPWTQLYTSPQRWLAVEPMTAPPNALNTGCDLGVLGPGEILTAEYSVLEIRNERGYLAA